MTKHESDLITPSEIHDFYQNMMKFTLKYQEALSKSLSNPGSQEPINLDPLNVNESFAKIAQEMMHDPKKVVDHNIELAKNYVNLWGNFAQHLLGNEMKPSAKPEPKDSRFKDEEWAENPLFNFIKSSYKLNSNWIQSLVHQFNHLDKKESKKVDFYTQLIVDAMAPTNFLATNPEALKETIKTNGANLVKGAENLLRDLSHSNGKFKISTANLDAFDIGRNLAMTPGKVVFQNDLMQLIQYEAQTPTVHKTPIIIMPAWINKYYILDLQAKNSFVNWLVQQGFTVFMMSWINPNEQHSDKTFESYLTEGPLAALDFVQKTTKEKTVNFAGYCLGGTLLSIALAYLKAKGRGDEIKSATFLTSLVDFTEAGDLSIFIDEQQLSMLESRMNEKGYLEGEDMAKTFNMIRANDMIWSFYVNNYLMGKDPFPFDILYWNSDSTRLPAKMHSFYLRNMYQYNNLVSPNKISLLGTPIDLSKIDTPTYLLATIQDHIVPWESAYRATQIYGGQVRFTLSGSGHVAGVVNHPSTGKYNHWTSDKITKTAKSWLEGAKENSGSWWVDWSKWLKTNSGELIQARTIDSKFAIENAPGSYVKVRIDNE